MEQEEPAPTTQEACLIQQQDRGGGDSIVDGLGDVAYFSVQYVPSHIIVISVYVIG